VTPDQKVNWLLDRDLLYGMSMKHEVYRTLRLSFALSAEDTQRAVIAKALEGPKPPDGKDGDEVRRALDYMVYNLLHWLSTSAPESSIARDAFEEFKTKHPTFISREYPDLDFWSSGATLVEHPSPVAAEKLRQMSPGDWWDVLNSTERGHGLYEEPDREGLLEETSRAVVMSFDWSFRLAQFLVEKQNQDSEVWDSILKGWAETPLSVDQWKALSELFESNPDIPGVARLLEKGIKKKNHGIPMELLGNLERLSDKIWELLEEVEGEEEEDHGWLTTAINRPAGKLTEFWLQALYRQRPPGGEKWSGLPGPYIERFEKILSQDCFAAQLARTVLASRLHFLIDIDLAWTKEKLVPQLDFESDELRAQQAWQGFLSWGRIVPSLVQDFKDFSLTAIGRLGDSSESYREQLNTYMTDLILGSPGNPLEDGWYYKVLRHESLTGEDRGEMARRIWHTLRDAGDEHKESLWTRWLAEYWSDRTQGIPVPFVAEEANFFLQWVTSLGVVFDQAVELAVRTNPFDLETTFLYSDLEESELLKSHPESVLKLLVHLLSNGRKSTLHGRYLQAIHNSLKEILGDEKIKALTNCLLGLGVP